MPEPEKVTQDLILRMVREQRSFTVFMSIPRYHKLRYLDRTLRAAVSACQGFEELYRVSRSAWFVDVPLFACHPCLSLQAPAVRIMFHI